MSRSYYKPTHLCRDARRHHKTLCEILAVRGFFKKLQLSRIISRYGVITNRHLWAYSRKIRIFGRLRSKNHITTPKRNDPVLRLTRYLTIYQNLSYGLRTRASAQKRRKLRKYYNTKKYWAFVRFGEFLRTRSYSGFRIRKDKKKVDKMKKDLAKAEKQALHWRRENARLMRKAVMETRAAKRNKANAKTMKKKK